VDPDGLARFFAVVPRSCLVVLDEAYRSYVDPARRPDVSRLLVEHPNLLVQRTFSKAYALAGLRIGYGMAAPEVIAMLDAIRPPFNVNVTGLAAARAALADRLQRLLAELGFEHYRSQANFVAVRPPRPAELVAALRAAGLAVRAGSDLGLDGWLRISIGSPPQMAVLRATLERHGGHG
jgi:histidinol-phosphate aminotransferase